jgi:hypothetical protein
MLESMTYFLMTGVLFVGEICADALLKKSGAAGVFIFALNNGKRINMAALCRLCVYCS